MKNNRCIIFLGYTPNNAETIRVINKKFINIDKFVFFSCPWPRLKSFKFTMLGLNPKNFILKLLSFISVGFQIRLLFFKYKHVDI